MAEPQQTQCKRYDDHGHHLEVLFGSLVAEYHLQFQFHVFACQSEVVQETVASGMFYLRHFFPVVQFTVNASHLYTAVQKSQQGYDDQYSQIGQYSPLNESLT